MVGFEPTTPALRKRCSTVELHRRLVPSGESGEPSPLRVALAFNSYSRCTLILRGTRDRASPSIDRGLQAGSEEEGALSYHPGSANWQRCKADCPTPGPDRSRPVAEPGCCWS